jgi:hypothetical protein
VKDGVDSLAGNDVEQAAIIAQVARKQGELRPQVEEVEP